MMPDHPELDYGERVLGYFPAGGLLRGWRVFVTTNRVLVNKGPVQVDWKAHVLLLVLGGLLTPIFFITLPYSLTVVVAGLPALIFYSHYRKQRVLRLDSIESGTRRFEADKLEVTSIVLNKPGRVRRGSFTIMSVSGESFKAAMQGQVNYRMASRLFRGFEPAKGILLQGSA